MKHTENKPHYYYCIVEGCDKKRQGGRGKMCGRHFTMHQRGTLCEETGGAIGHGGDGEDDDEVEEEQTYYEEEDEEAVEEGYCGDH